MMYPILEPILQYLRIHRVFPHLPKGGVLVDLGCDKDQALLNKMSPYMKKCIGVDVVCPNEKRGNIQIVHQDIQKNIKLKSGSADVVTMLAVLEHMKHPEHVASECYRILKKNGTLLITVPSPSGEFLLDVFAKVGLIRQEMIDQHENYFTPERLKRMCKKAGFSQVEVSMFEFGFNTFVRAVK